MSQSDNQLCPECGEVLVKELYEEYLFCNNCGWDEELNFSPIDGVSVETIAEEAEEWPDHDEEPFDPNLDPEAGENV